MDHYSLEPANFQDYRDFLKSRFKSINDKQKSFSLNACAQRSGVSKSLLQFVFQKKRHLGLDRIPKVAQALKLTANEEYFTYLMVCHNSSQNAQVRAHFEQILSRIRHEYIKTDIQQPPIAPANDKSLYLDHMNMILKTMLRWPDFKEDPRWIKEQLLLKDVSEEMISEYLVKIEKAGYIFRNDQGKLESKKGVVWKPDPYDPTGQSVYTAGAQAVANLMKTPEWYRPSVYASMSLAMDEDNLQKAEKYMLEVHHHLCALAAQSEKPTAVTFIGNYFLTVARQKQKP